MNLRLVDKYYNSTEYIEKLRSRAKQLEMAAGDDLARSRMILDVWAVNPIEFIETFLWLKLPNYQNALKPFFLFDYQKRIILKILEAEQDTQEHTILIDKPREMGITWLIAAYYYWRWLFTPEWSGFILSRTESEVDDGSTSPDNSIMGKLRWLMARTPKFMLPEGFQPKGKKGTSTDMVLKIMNPAMKTSINGSTTNASAGRSRRYSITEVDECFYIEHFDEVYRSLESVSRVKLYISSARKGRRFEKFKDMCEAKGDYINLTWRDHPWKDDEWFAELQRKAQYDPEIMREAIVDYTIDKASQYYPQINEATVAPLQYDETRPLYVSLDIGRADLTVLIWWQYDGNNFKAIECFSSKNHDIEWYAPFLNPQLTFIEAAYPVESHLRFLKRLRAWKKPSAWFGEHDHFKKSMASNRSCADVLAKHGIRLMYNSYAINYEPRRKATSAVLPMTIFNENSEYVNELYDAMVNSRYASTVAPTSLQTVLKPVHDDEIADYRSAFENMAVNLPRVLRLQRSETRDERSRTLTDSIMRYVKIK